jgi:hypothetical protein
MTVADVPTPAGETGRAESVPEAILRRAVADHYDIAESVVRTIFERGWDAALASVAPPMEDPFVAVTRSQFHAWEKRLASQADEIAALRAENQKIKNERILSVVFGHHKDAPRPFVLCRREDVSGVSGTGIVAEGAAFSDGTAVLRWLSDWPTSVVFHDRGIEAIEKIHGHSGATKVVWCSDELEPLAEMEQQRDAARAELASLRASDDQAVNAGSRDRETLLAR